MHWGIGWGMGMSMGWIWICWLALLGVALFVERAMGGASASKEKQESPETILEHRYARSEIDKEEYHRRLADLRR